MEENLSAEQQEQLRYNDIVSEWLGEARFTVRVMADIDDALSLLIAKRTTLEEKIISQEFHALCANYADLLALLHRRLGSASPLPDDALEQLRTLNFDVREAVDTLLKALRYNLNYTEQYFEYNFSSRLKHEWCFAEQAARLVSVFKA